MRKPSKLFIALTTLPLLLLQACTDNSPEGRIKTAKEAMQAADYKTATIELKNVIQVAPNNLEARILLGRSLQEYGHWADSEKHLKKSLELGGPPEQVLPLLARALVKMGSFQEALNLEIPKSGLSSQALGSLLSERANALMAMNKLDAAEQVVKEGEAALSSSGTEKESIDLELTKANIAFAHHQMDQAHSILDSILKKDSKSYEAMFLKAQFYRAEDKEEQALKTLLQITANRPFDMAAQISIADIHMRANNLGAAETALSAAEKNDRNLPTVKHMRALLEMRKGKLKEANDAILQVLRVAPDHIPSISLSATINYGLGNYEQSLKSASRVLAEYPNNLFILKLVAANQLRKGDAKAALETLKPKLAINTNDAQLLSLIGEAYLQSKSYAKAMEYLDRAAALQPKNAEIKHSQARGYLAMGQAERAISSLEQATELGGRPGHAESAIVTLYLSRKEFDKALQAISALEKKMPDNPATHNLRGIALLGKKDRPSARKAFEQSLAIQPAFFPAVANLAKMDVEDNKPDQARQRFLKVLDKDANHLEAMMALAKLALFMKQENDYQKWLTQALKTNPKALPPRIALIKYQLAKNDAQKALTNARETISLHPDNIVALSLLGRAQFANGDHNSAISSFSRVVEKEPKSVEGLYDLGVAQLAASRLADARASLEQALAIQPHHLEARIKLHQSLMLAGNKSVAAQVLASIMKEHRGSPIAQAYLAQYYTEQGLHQEAIAVYQAMLQKTPGSAVLLNNLANLYLQAKDARALQTAEQAYKIAPENPEVLDTLGWILTGSGQIKRALSILEKAASKASTSPTIRYHYAVALARDGNRSAAKRELEPLIQGKHTFPELPEAKKLFATF